MLFPQADLYFLIILYYFPVNCISANSTAPTNTSESDHDQGKPITSSNTTQPAIPWDSEQTILRALIVVACVSLIAVVYLLVRCLRHKHKMNKGRKYGLIASQEDKMELRPLDQADEEDDMTIFDRTPGKPHGQYDLLRNAMKLKDKAP